VTAQRDEESYRERRAFWAGSNDGLTMAIEFTAIPLLFALFGLWIDHVAGTGPWLTVVLAAFGVIGVAVRSYYLYKAKMEVEEEGKPWTRRARRTQ
jgi:F0F1-type ATP synthase assembly protein I